MLNRYGKADRTYHGIPAQHDDIEDGVPARILVEHPESGPTQRQNGKVLRELAVGADELGFGWGYNGGGTSQAAAAVLADALNIDIELIEFPAGTDRLLCRLREDFCEDVLSQLCDEWRLRRGAVLRWVRGWYAQYGLRDLPAAVAELPRIHFDDTLDARPTFAFDV